MTKQRYFIIFGWFALGFVVGGTIIYIAAAAHARRVHNAFFLYKATEYALDAQQASKAYYESQNLVVAIYALSQHLLTLHDEAAEAQTNPFESEGGVALGMVITHGRLAKLYAQSGEADLKAQHVAEALDWSKKTGRTFTNETDLANFIASSDRIFGAKPTERKPHAEGAVEVSQNVEASKRPAHLENVQSFSATVVSVAPLGTFTGTYLPVGDPDPMFALTVRIESAEPPTNILRTGSIVTFGIHSPSRLFVGESRIGQRYDFVMQRDTNGIVTGLHRSDVPRPDH